MISALFVLAAQDLFARDAELRRRLSPDVRMNDVRPQGAVLELGAGLDFACGSFDLKSSFKSLFKKNVAEEFLGGTFSSLQGQLAQSPLVLACYASPTVCDAIKHYRVTANAMLGMELDGCRALEQGLEDVQRRAQARAVKECLDRKAKAGLPLDEAQRACAGARTMQGLQGGQVREIDLRRDLGISDPIVGNLTVGAGTLTTESKPEAVAEEYERLRQESLRAWESAVRDPAGAPVSKLGPVTREDLEKLALMEPARRAVAIRSLASVQALADLLTEVHRVERALESGELRATPEVREEMERRRTQLRSETARVLERFDVEQRVARAVGEVQAAAEAEVAGKARVRLAGRRAAETRDHALDRTKPWGCEVKRTKGDGDAQKQPASP